MDKPQRPSNIHRTYILKLEWMVGNLLIIHKYGS